MEEQNKYIKERLVLMLKAVDKLCRKNNIPYYVIGGTFLGAVRHKGFIPWDDDIDIAIPRPYYQKFLDLAQEELKDYQVATKNVLNNNDVYYFYYAKLRDNTVKVLEEKYQSNNQYSGIWIDVFAIDGIPDRGYNWFKFRLNYLRMLKSFSQINYIRKLDNRSLGQRFLIKFAQITKLGKFINQKKVVAKINKILESNSYEEATKVGTIFGSYGFREIVLKEYFGTPKEYDFEGFKVLGPEKYHEYLTQIYGDYMKLPPLEKRVPMHYKDVRIEGKKN